MNTLLLIALLLANPAAESAAEADRGRAGESAMQRVSDHSVIGTVSDGRSPLPATGVYAYRLADLSLRKVVTDARGAFDFGALPSGVYKIIAHKQGFLPAMTVLTRANAAVFQQVDFDLSREEQLELDETADFWSIRERIPTDVLREITIANAPQRTQQSAPANAFSAEIQALSGSGQFAHAESSLMTGGAVDLAAQFGEVEVGIEGSFRDLDAKSGVHRNQSLGSQNGIAVRLDTGASDPLDSEVYLTGQRAELATRSIASAPVDYERYGVQWDAQVAGGTSKVRADFTEEANFYRDPRLQHFGLPTGSTTLQLHGEYDRDLGERSAIRTGLRYSNRSSTELSPAVWGDELRRFELFGVADFEVADSVLIEYGLFTTMNAGQVAFTPHAGVVIDLPQNWQARASLRERVESEQGWQVGFAPLYHGSAQECSSAESRCYEVEVAHLGADQRELRIAATLREFSDIARLYFSDDFFDQFDSLLFLPGDELPEVRISLAQRLSPSISARFESSVASGGGGVFEGNTPRENQVEYMVTSLDTQFERSQTGVLLAFHSLEQSLENLAHRSTEQGALDSYDMDRLQLLVTQGLGRLLGAGLNWDLLLDMQVSRGSDPFQVAEDQDELRRRVVGGLAVRF